ncbi:hypothetical protein [Candidatus Entotheonella palauensis]|uniref:hypothetical protein n=1 Tax=Candidatus Entotheonella palauensis TaxID=93172 RepID=UPI0011776518|nr:hypothetical protein [Candidatus Entotheonella palauensis]
MAETTLVKEALTQEMIDIGKELAQQLTKTWISVSAVFWLYSPESNLWRFIVGSPDVKTQGPRRVYQEIQKILTQSSQKYQHIALQDIDVFGPEHPLVSWLKVASKPKKDTSDTRFVRHVVNGHFIEDAYIYQI